MSTSRSILELARAIVKDAETLDEHVRSNNLPQPSFDVNGPNRLDFDKPEVADAQARLLSSTKELHCLALGPTNCIRLALNTSQNAAALSTVHRLNIAQHVPVDDQATIEELAAKVGVPRTDLKTVLRLAMTDYIFCEPSPGVVAHTAASRVLVENPFIKGWIDIGVDELFPASTKLAEALIKHPGCEEPTLSGWAIENNAQLPLFDELAARHPTRAANFARAMEFMAKAVEVGVASRCFDWASLGKAKVVDLGGGKGPVAIELARAFPDLELVVQDLEETVMSGQSQLPEDMKGRVTFVPHDFFSTQSIEADVYHFRAVFHNWPDKYCVKILQALIPALKKGARVIIQDPVFPEPGQFTPYQQEQSIASDLMMMAYFNSHNREEAEWPELFAKADRRFRVERITRAGTRYPEARMGAIEVTWTG